MLAAASPKLSDPAVPVLGDCNSEGARAEVLALATALGAKVWGPMPLDRIHIRIAEGERAYPSAVHRRTEEHWWTEKEARPHIFDAPVWCLRSFTPPWGFTEDSGSEDGVEFELQQSSFKYVLYTHFSPDAVQLPEAHRAGSVGLAALTETADGYLVLGRRSSRLACLPGHWHFVPAGQVDSSNPQHVLEQELHEELGCEWDEVVDSRLLALMDCGAEQGHKSDFIFWLRLSLNAADVEERFACAEDSSEHDGLIFVRVPGRWRPASVATRTLALDEFLGRYQLVDIARRSLILFERLVQDGPVTA